MALRIPRVLAFTVLGAATAAAAVVSSCGDPEGCPVVCLPLGSGDVASCPPRTCADHNMCPEGCIPEPVG